MRNLKKELYQLIRQDESVFEFIQESIGDGLSFWDLNQPEKRWFNNSFWNALGYNPNQFENNQLAWQKVIHQDDVKVLLGWDANEGQISNQPNPFVVRFIHRSGETLFFECKNFILTGENGKPSNAVGLLSNNSLKNHIEIEISRTQKRLKETLFNLGDVVMILDSNFIIREYTNNRIEEILFPEKDQFINKHLNDVGLPEDLLLTYIEAINQAKIDGSKTGIEYHHSYGDKDEIYSATITAIKDEMGKVLEIIISSRKITEQKKAENQIYELSLVASKTNDLTVITDSNGKITWVNKAFEIQTGFSLDDMIGKFLPTILLGPETSKQTISRVEKAILKRSSLSEILVNYSKNFKKYWVEIQIDPVFNEAGHCSHFICIERDITNRKEWEDELAATKEILLETNRVAKIGGWSYDASSDTVRWTEVTREIHEVESDYVPTVQSVLQFYQDGESRQRYFEAGMGAFQKGIPYDVELKIVTAKGNVIWVRTICKVEFENGECKRMYGTFQDITSFKEVELKIIESVKLLHNVTDQAPGALYQYTMKESGEFFFTFISGGIYSMTGIQPEEIKKNSNLLFDIIIPEDIQRVNDSILESYKNLTRWECDFKVQIANGEMRWFRGISKPEKWEEGVLWNGYLQDITNHKIAGENS